MNDTIAIERNEDTHRYELTVEGALAGYAEFRSEPGRITFTHTIVRSEYGGRGLGTRLAKFVLDDAVARGERVVPKCPFIAAYLREHGGYEASVDWPA